MNTHVNRIVVVILVTLSVALCAAGTVSAEDIIGVRITQGMPYSTYETTAVFYFEAYEGHPSPASARDSDRIGSLALSVTLQCKLEYLDDAGAFVILEPWDSCSSPKTYGGLSYGSTYMFSVRVATAYSMVAWNQWSILTPSVTFDSGPEPWGYSTDATLAFHSTPEGVPLECQLVGAPLSDPQNPQVIEDWYACTSPQTFASLGYGMGYLLLVKAAGAPDSAAELYAWSVWIPPQQSQTISFGPIPAKTFGDPPFTLSASASSGLPVSFSASGNCTVSGSTVSITGAGSCTVTASQSGNESWFAAPDVAQSFDIAKKPATVMADNKSKAYGGANPPLTATVAGEVAGNPINYSLSTTAGPCSDVGEHPIVVTLGANPNYDVIAVDGALAINPKDASVTAAGQSRTYGEDNPALTATVAGEVCSAAISYSLSTTAVKLSGAGEYAIVVTLGANPNYNVIAADGTLAISPKDASVTAGDQSKTYGEDNPALTAVVVGQVVGGDAIDYSLSTTAGPCSDVGEHPIAVTLGANPNYNVTATGGVLAIAPRDASVTATNNFKTYGDDNPALMATTAGTACSVAIDYSLDTTAGTCSDVGEYPIAVTPGSNPNYNVTATGATLAITPKDASVTADDKAKTYGEDNPALTATVMGEVMACDVIDYSLSTTADTLSGVGEYTIVVTLGTDPNYHVSKTDGVLTIEPASLTVTPDDWEAGYSDPNPAELTFAYDGWIAGEGPLVLYLTSAPVCSTTRERLSPAGSYPIICSGGAAPNYEFIYVPGTFTVITETAEIAYTGDTQVTTAKVGAKATVTLAATLEEEQDGFLGVHLAGQQIVFEVFGFGDTTYTTPLAACMATIGNVVNGKGFGSCHVDLGAADPYQVKIGLADNDYYTAGFETIVVLVNDPGIGFTAGGGWLIDPNSGSRANFGFIARFLKNGRVQGNSLFVYRVALDLSTVLPGAPAGEREYNWIIKSNAMQGLNIYDCELDTTSGCKATITGKNTVQAVDRLTGVLYSIGGNYQFQVDVTDNQEPGAPPGAGPDQYAIRVWSTSGTYYELGDTYDDNGMLLGPLGIMGGNIQVKARK